MTMMCMLLAFSTVCSSVVYWQEVWLLILNIVEQWSYVVLKPLHTGYFVRGEGGGAYFTYFSPKQWTMCMCEHKDMGLIFLSPCFVLDG